MGGRLSSIRLPAYEPYVPAPDYSPTPTTVVTTPAVRADRDAVVVGGKENVRPISPKQNVRPPRPPSPKERVRPVSPKENINIPAARPPSPKAVAVSEPEKAPEQVTVVPEMEKVQPALVEELLAALLGDNAVKDHKVLHLLESSNPNLTLDKTGLKPIHVAVIQKNLGLLQKVLANRDTDVNVRHAGLTPLHFATQLVLLDVVKELLKQRNVQVNARTTAEEQTPLMFVIATDSVVSTEEDKAAVVRCLVDDPRCEVGKEDGDGWIALTFAARHGNVPVGQILLGEERSANYTINQLVNAYRQALLGGHDSFCDLLMDSLTSTQKEQIRHMVANLKQMSGTTPFLRELLHRADTILDSGYMENQISSGPAWDRHDQLLEPGSVVKLLKDKGVVRALQKNVGKHLDGLDNVVGQCGLVRSIDQDSVISVDFAYFGSPHTKLRSINPKAVDRLSQDDYHSVDANGVPIYAGDTIRLIDDPVALENMTYTAMATDITTHVGHAGVLKYFNQACLPVIIVAGLPWSVDSMALRKVTSVIGSDSRPIHVGDTVEISSSKADLERLQTPLYGGWKPAISLALGKSGMVTHIGCECFTPKETPDCFITVRTDRTEVSLNPLAVWLKTIEEQPAEVVAAAPVAKPRRPAPTIPSSPKQEEIVVYDIPDEIKATEQAEEDVNEAVTLTPVLTHSKSEGDLIDLETKKEPTLPLSQTTDRPFITLKRERSNPIVFLDETDKSATTVDMRGKNAPVRKSARFIPYEEIHFLEKIGKGGFGTVYRARWRGSNCAVKVIKCDDSDEGAETQGEVLAEAECHGSVNHPHIVQFLGFSFNDADQLNLNAYIVLKFVDGFNLHQCIFGYKLRFTAEEKYNVALQISDAIRYLHDDAKIIHQDIKPHNILIDKVTREAMVTDFGISRVFSDPPIDVTMAMYTQHACGSLPYMAPELVIISKRTSMYRKATEASDIWSLAATLTEMFTGKSLYDFSATPDLHTLVNLKASSDLPIAILEASLPVRACLESSLRRMPEDRPKSCSEVIRLLEEYGDELQAQISDSEV